MKIYKSLDIEMKVFVADILKRRAYQYDFSEEQVNLDLSRLSNSLNTFTFENDSIWVAGTYSPYKKTINLNP